MSTKLALVAAALVAVLAGPALARDHVRHMPANAYAFAAVRSAPGLGQYPAPAALAAQSALPACGFAAVESWGQNGFQYCDGRNERPAYDYLYRNDFQLQGRP